MPSKRSPLFSNWRQNVPRGIEGFNRAAKQLIREHSDLNVLINDAGIMQPDQAAGRIDDALLLATVNTNLIGSIRVTSALIEHLKTKDNAGPAEHAFVDAFNARMLSLFSEARSG
jgi:NAD(P)-dependent dehydrogenase (short-subunit alcohol dehydrogenase family)